MKKRWLGKTRLKVSAMGLGCWSMSHAYGPADEKEAVSTIAMALDSGIDFFDTADVYGNGHNESLLGRALSGRRQEATIATKFGFSGDERGRLKIDGRPEYVQAACEKSLKRLGTDVIDLYYLHRLDPERPIEDTVSAMADLVQQGKVRHLGLSEVSKAVLRRAHEVFPITAIQSEYSLWSRDVEAHVLPTCRELNVGLVAFSPLGRGFLTGCIRSRDELAENDYRRDLPRFQGANFESNLVLVRALQDMAEDMGASPAQLALAWLLAQGEDVVPIPGMKRPGHLPENIAAADLQLSPDDLARLSNIGTTVVGARHNRDNLRLM